MRAVMDSFREAAVRGDGPTACELLTDEGRASLEDFGDEDFCETTQPRSSGEDADDRVRLGAVGVDDDSAIAIERVSPRVEVLPITLLRRVEGEWLIDAIAGYVTPEKLEAAGSGSPEALAVAEEYGDAVENDDGETACELLTPASARSEARAFRGFPDYLKRQAEATAPGATSCELWYSGGVVSHDNPQDVEGVVAIGDVAIAFRKRSSPALVLRTPDGWRIDTVLLS